MRPEPFALASPRMDRTQHMAHQRAAADAERLQRQRPVEAGSAAPEPPPRTPRPQPAAIPQEQPAADRECPVVSVPQPAGEAPHSIAASAAAANVLQGGQRAASLEATEYPQGEPCADKGAACLLLVSAQHQTSLRCTAGCHGLSMCTCHCISSTARRAGDAQQPAATPACRRLESSLPHRTPLGQPQRVIDPSARCAFLLMLRPSAIPGIFTASADCMRLT